MNRLLSIVMLLAVGTQMFWGSGYLLDYYIDTEYYKERCENKLRPELNCDGKCILSQKLKEQAKNEQDATTPSPVSAEYTLEVREIDIYCVSEQLIRSCSGYLNTYQSLKQHDIFKPPI